MFATVPDGSPSGSLATVPEASVSTKDTTFIIFGIGGTPSSPEEVIIAPLEKLQKPHVMEKYLRSLHHHDLSRTLYYYAKENRLM